MNEISSRDTAPTAARADAPFVRACRGEATDYTPVWLNRQAGRYMPEYMALKAKHTSLELFTVPELAARATIDAQRILGVDAAIMFADLLPVLIPMGLDLDYVGGVGPVFANPIERLEDIAALRVVEAAEGTPYIAQTIGAILDGLPNDIPVIGFAGAPFTLAAYAIEGKTSRNYIRAKKLMWSHSPAWFELMDKLTDVVISYVQLQIDAGVQAVQIFDSWVGHLSISDYERFVAPSVARLMNAIGGRVPIIYFGTGNQHLLDAMAKTGPDLMAFDWRTPLVASWDRLGLKAAQGNMDPIVLCADRAAVRDAAGRVLDEVDGRPGHIFNLGHGIVPETPVDNVKFLVDFVHEQSDRSA